MGEESVIIYVDDHDIVANEHRSNKYILQSISEKIKSIDRHPTEERAKFFIPRRKRNENVEYFFPEIHNDPFCVSIGPYYHGMSELAEMEDIKKECLAYIINQRGLCLEDLLNKLRIFENEVEKMYENITMAKDEFLQLLLTDACFIIVCNLQKIEENQVFKNKQSSVNPLTSFLIRKNDQMASYSMLSDALMVENQIPVIFTKIIWEMVYDTGVIKEQYENFNDVIYKCFECFTGHAKFKIDTKEKRDFDQFGDTLLDIVHYRNSMHLSENYQEHHHLPFWTPSVTQLQKVGVKFKTKFQSRSCLDITFKDGVLEIPRIQFRHLWWYTITNFMDFEKRKEIADRKISGFILFMCQLLKTPNDARILSEVGILNTGSELLDERIPKLFVDLWSQAKIGVLGCNFPCKLGITINKYYKTWYNLWFAVLKRNYNDNPWFSVSTIVAAIVLFSSIAQIDLTVSTVKP